MEYFYLCNKCACWNCVHRTGDFPPLGAHILVRCGLCGVEYVAYVPRRPGAGHALG